METEVEELYSSLNKLLNDICKFLTDEANYRTLSPFARIQADELINRSKHQLQEISKITTNDIDGAYVDMDRKPSVEDEDDEDPNNIYSSVDENNLKLTTVTAVTLEPNPYADLPAKQLKVSMKYGPLQWRIKFILNFEKMRRFFCGIHNNWLLIYSNEKDVKPIQTFNLKIHKAQPVPSKQTKNPSHDFQLLSTKEEKRTYYFAALTHKDMLQWVSHINRGHEFLNSAKTEVVTNEDLENYDSVGEVTSYEESIEEDDDDAIYHDIQLLKQKAGLPKRNIITEIPPDLPCRKLSTVDKTNIPLPSIPSPCPSTPKQYERQDSQETSDYDAVILSSDTSRNSLSDDDDDNFYEEFIAPKIIPDSKNNQIHIMATQKPIVNNQPEKKPKPPNLKPKPLLKLEKKFSYKKHK